MVVLLVVAALVGAAVWWYAGRRSAPDPPASPYPLRVVILESVSNASGLVLVQRHGQRWVAVVDEVDEWSRPEEPPSLISIVSPVDGETVMGERKVAEFGEVEALAVRDGRIVFPYKTGAQEVVIRDGDRDIRVIGRREIAALTEAASQVATGPFFFELEGLAWTDGSWEFIVAALAGSGDEGPRSTRCILRARLGAEGGLQRISPPLRQADGTLRTDYAAALHVLPNGNAIVPGFSVPGVWVYDWTGAAVLDLGIAVQRIEGVDWDPQTRELFLVRECVGQDDQCDMSDIFGVPLYVVSLPFDL